MCVSMCVTLQNRRLYRAQSVVIQYEVGSSCSPISLLTHSPPPPAPYQTPHSFTHPHTITHHPSLSTVISLISHNHHLILSTLLVTLRTPALPGLAHPGTAPHRQTTPRRHILATPLPRDLLTPNMRSSVRAGVFMEHQSVSSDATHFLTWFSGLTAGISHDSR